MLLTKNLSQDAISKDTAEASGKKASFRFATMLLVIVFASTIGFFAISYFKHPVAVITGISMLPNYTQDEVHVTTRTFITPERFRVVLFKSEEINNPSANLLRQRMNISGNFAKRVMGVPGDVFTLSLDTGLFLTLNGQPFTYENDLSKPTFDVVDKSNINTFVPAAYLYETIGDKTHAVYALATPKSSMTTEQSKLIEQSIIPLSTKALNGKVEGNVVTIKVPEGKLFLVSDNRVDGLDSRQLGFVPVHAVISVFEEK